MNSDATRLLEDNRRGCGGGHKEAASSVRLPQAGRLPGAPSFCLCFFFLEDNEGTWRDL